MKMSRRSFIHGAAAGTALAFPTIIPSRVLGANAPSNTLNVAQIGCGRIGRSMDAPGFMKANGARIVAACDLDSRRLAGMQQVVARHYKTSADSIIGVRDFHDLISRSDIDIVSISTPDHWHAQIAIEAAFAGKHVYMQKPASLTIRAPFARMNPGASIVRPMRPHPICATLSALLGAFAPSTRAGMMVGNARAVPAVAAFCKKPLLVICVFMPCILPNQ